MVYFIQTMMDFKNGTRKSTDSRKANAANMARFAKAMTDEEIKTAAEYFGAIKWTPWIKVVETAQVPKTRIAGGLFVALPGDEKEPLGTRVIEVPETPKPARLCAIRNRLHCLRSGWQHQEGRGAGDHGRWRQDGRVRQLPRRGFEGPGSGSWNRRAVAELHGAANVRHPAGLAKRCVV